MRHAVRDNGMAYWLHLIVNTARHYRGWARVRALWSVVARGYYGEQCMTCGRRYDATIWWCPDSGLWRTVTGSATGLSCPACFSRKADLIGLPLLWEPRLLPGSKAAATSEVSR